ncbi:hypothetical protein [Rathayibacter sp. VKM Ac-2760]|uniref:hypothetical protein n=1 Tax=Rathayibacter sp. VKM Ac-2760 TaxID=2609253 RepID=UPI001FC96A30|nr:hypothetical protein [Rathayibacter sp. VKM Ac-2760]
MPVDVSVVEYNDIPVVRHLPTTLSSVHVPLDLIAQRSVGMLLDDRTEGQVFPLHDPSRFQWGLALELIIMRRGGSSP